MRLAGQPRAGAHRAPLGEAGRGEVLSADEPAVGPDPQRQRPLLGLEGGAQAPLEAQRPRDPLRGIDAVPAEHVGGVLVLEDRPTQQLGVLGQVRVAQHPQGEVPGAQGQPEGREQGRELVGRGHRDRVDGVARLGGGMALTGGAASQRFGGADGAGDQAP